MELTDINIISSDDLHQLVRFKANSEPYVYYTYKDGFKTLYADGELYTPMTHSRLHHKNEWKSCYYNKEFQPIDPLNPRPTIEKMFKVMLLQ